MSTKNILSVLSGDIWNDSGVWRTTDYNVPRGAPHVILDSFRIQAAAAYLKKYNAGEVVVLVQGGLADTVYPSLASVMRRELLELGVPETELELEERSQTTYQQLFLLQDRAAKETAPAVKILSNDWHLPRIRAMVESVPGLAALRALNPEFVEAEEILLQTNPAQWQKKVETLRANKEVQTRVMQEQEGVAEIRNGTYRFR